LEFKVWSFRKRPGVSESESLAVVFLLLGTSCRNSQGMIEEI
jgi:hypothetical protein